MSKPVDWYQGPLARIHDERYSQFAIAAADTARGLLPTPTSSGLIVDLGCGSGAASERLTATGYNVLGIDISAAMLDIARRKVPSARFNLESVYDAQLPRCQAVLAIGEIFNYLSTDRTEERLDQLLARIWDALVPGGFLLFDVANPGRSQATAAEQTVDGDGWWMSVRSSENEAGVLRRSILTVMREPPGDVRSEEQHLLQLLPVQELRHRLTQIGFIAQLLPGYHDLPLPGDHGWSAWLATKP